MEIDGALGVELLLGALLLLSYLWWRLSRGPGASLWSGARSPPVQGGWLPWVGCAVDFGREPLWYIKKTQEKVGLVIPNVAPPPLATPSSLTIT